MKQSCTITAHSGCINTKPNSIESIIAGFDTGADITEIDVRFAPDGTPVLSHDDLNNNEKPVTLAEAFDVIKKYPGKKINLDIKETSNLPAIQSLAYEKGIKEQVFLTGVWENFAEPVRKGCPDIPFYLNKNFLPYLKNIPAYIKYLISLTKKYGAIGINLNKNFCSETLITKFHEAGLLVSVWTITDIHGAKKYLSMKPDNITCKNPDEVISFIGKD